MGWKRKPWRAVLAAIVVVSVPVSGAGISAAAGSQVSASPSATRTEAPASRAEVESLENQVESAGDNYDRIFYPFAFLVAILTGGGIIGVVLSLRTEQRQGEIHRLGIDGEAAAQKRAAETHLEFLEDSHKTLTLVNDTLSLAKEASKRAEEAVKGKVSGRLHDLNREAEGILKGVYGTGDFKTVVRDGWTEERLKELAERFRGVEDDAESEGLDLPPHCLFAKGLDRHLRFVPEGAINSWQEAAAGSKEPELAALALFWVGYEWSNVGEFKQAIAAYQTARIVHLKDTGKAQHHELRRIEVQTKFFELAREYAEDHNGASSDRRPAIQEFIDELEEIRGSLNPNRKEFRKEMQQCSTTIGELLIWSARLSPLERQGEALTAPERSCLEEAVERFEEGGDGVWAQFGRAQAKWALGDDKDRPSESEYHDLLDTLLGEAGSHREPRTLALRHAAILIAEGEHHDGEEALDQAYRDLWHDVHDVGGRLTVFSPWQKRNVALDDFKSEVRAYRRSCQAGNRGETAPLSGDGLAGAAGEKASD